MASRPSCSRATIPLGRFRGSTLWQENDDDDDDDDNDNDDEVMKRLMLIRQNSVIYLLARGRDNSHKSSIFQLDQGSCTNQI